jgi:hypothetical protein
MAEVKPCHKCGTTTGKAPLAAMCNRCADLHAFSPSTPERQGDQIDRENEVNSAPLVGLTVHVADLSKSAPPRFAWQDRLVLGYLNLLIGNEGVGKGTLMAWVIARLTRGELPGDLKGQPVGVGVLGDEDSFADVWTPRLHAAKADLARVVQIERPDGGFVEVGEDREKLSLVIKERGLRVLFFDQLLDNLGVGVDDWRQKAVRESLQPIRALARELDIVTLGSLHPNKRADSFRQLVSGASSFNAVSRSSLLLAQHPDDESRRVLARGKGNLSQTPESVEFELAEERFNANGYEFKVPVARGFKAGDLTVDDLMGNDAPREEHSKIAEACEIIEALLPRDGGWHPAKPIKEACAADGVDDRMAKRAKERLGIEHRRAAAFHAGTEWRWPTQGTAQDTPGPSVPTVPSSPSGPSGTAQKSLLSGSWATGATQDSEDKGQRPDPSDGRGDDLQPLPVLERLAWERRMAASTDGTP